MFYKTLSVSGRMGLDCTDKLNYACQAIQGVIILCLQQKGVKTLPKRLIMGIVSADKHMCTLQCTECLPQWRSQEGAAAAFRGKDLAPLALLSALPQILSWTMQK